MSVVICILCYDCDDELCRYPIVYCVTVLPLSVVRWIGFVQEKHGRSSVPSAATFSVCALFGLSGLFNVVLLMTTKPESGLFGRLMFTAEAKPPSPLPLTGQDNPQPQAHPHLPQDAENPEEGGYPPQAALRRLPP